MPKPVLSIRVNPRDIARIDKRLSKWQGKPLHMRMDKAIQGGLGLYVNPIRFGAQRHRVTGDTYRSVRVRKLRKRAAEVAAWKVGPNTWYAHFPISGPYGSKGDPYVDRAREVNEGRVQSFIDQQVRRLA